MRYVVRGREYTDKRSIPFNLNGAILYLGPSAYDGSLIAEVITGIDRPSKNAKTTGKDPDSDPGAWTMQTFALRLDVDPVSACRSGSDAALCGDCIHRAKGGDLGTRTCYVALYQAPYRVYECLAGGRYLWASEHPLWDTIKGSGRFVRIGSYGDPAMIPAWVWVDLLAHLGGKHTGYTHCWRLPFAQDLVTLCAASCDNMEDYKDAKAAGWGTFTTVPHGTVGPKSVPQCPASKEMGHLLGCAECTMCNGQHDRWIVAHGKTSGKFSGKR